MSFLSSTATAHTIKLKLRLDRTRMLKQGYPWIFRNWLVEAPAAPAGTRVKVQDRDGSLLAFGMYDPESTLAVRVCAIEKERLDDALLLSRFTAAHALRTALFSAQDTNGFRLINGEGDGLPGLVCDQYSDTAVLKFDGNGPAAFWNLGEIVRWLIETAAMKQVYLKHRAGENTRGDVLHGTLRDPSIRFREHGALFEADIAQGQKTGFFFDQRENRLKVKTFARGRRVLNLCGYTGGFSVYAGLGGASAVTTVDIAAPAIAAAKRNWLLNKLPEAAHTAVSIDAFEFLDAAHSHKENWDLMVIDPPSFASAEKQVPQAKASYQRLFEAGLKCLAKNGIIAFSSCSSHISPASFSEICQLALSRTRRRATVLSIAGQPEDHPFPLACPELQYLKFLLLQAQ